MQPQPQASSGNTTVFDESITQLLTDGYATPQKSETESPHLSQSSEPLPIRQPSTYSADVLFTTLTL
jgi:hypothetical protein